jgi:hypothetical protein
MAETRTTSSTGGQKGVKLARHDLIPTGPLTELAEHFGVGASKYANHQWRNGYEWSKSYAALMRHLTEFWGGKDYDVCSNDPEGCSHVDAEGRPFVAVREDACFNHTGSHHMAAVAWHAFALLEFKDRFPEHDDRYRPAEPEPVVAFRAEPITMNFDISGVSPETLDLLVGVSEQEVINSMPTEWVDVVADVDEFADFIRRGFEGVGRLFDREFQVDTEGEATEHLNGYHNRG